jgi:integrase/recombinase XerD
VPTDDDVIVHFDAEARAISTIRRVMSMSACDGDGSTGRAAVLTGPQVRQVFRIARSRQRHADRAEAVFALSVGLGLRAKELASLKWGDVYEQEGRVRQVVHLKAAYTKGAKTRDVFVSSPPLRRILANYGEKRRPWVGAVDAAPLFRSQKGRHMTASSIARFLTGLYREAGIPSASQRPHDAAATNQAAQTNRLQISV